VARISPSSITQSDYNTEISKGGPPEGLYALFILKESGCPFFYRIFTANADHPDPAILGGFFIALSLFAKEVTDGQIETITTEPCKYTFYPLRNGLLVISSAKAFNPILLERIAKRIAKLFLTTYRDQLVKPQPASICAPDLNQQIERILSETLKTSYANASC
jgi:hypothetical protein